jgi:outer membrane protein assembly factor BamE (lipoprotein component of BamABCDE complex)
MATRHTLTLASSALSLGLAMLSLAGCAHVDTRSGMVGNGDLTHGNVQLALRVGKTTQNDVLETFGAPNVTTLDATGQEVWTYQRHATISQRGSANNYWTVVLLGGSTRAEGFEQTQRTMTLMIKFDANKVVSDFKSRTAEF